MLSARECTSLSSRAKRLSRERGISFAELVPEVTDRLGPSRSSAAGPRTSSPAARARELLPSSSLEVLRPELDEELEALELFEMFADQGVSFTDCVSIAFMRKRGIGRAVGFDRHFVHAGFELWPPDEL